MIYSENSYHANSHYLITQNIMKQEPNPADPLNQEAAEVFRNNINVFKQNVQKSLNGGYVGGTHFPKARMKNKGYGY